MKIKAPFKITYDGPHKVRVWGLGAAPGFEFGYNMAGGRIDTLQAEIAYELDKAKEEGKP